jgi:hypothetical protein
MKLHGLEKALRDGCRLHGFRSGAGLRVICIEQGKKTRGYGEHPHVEDALAHADEDVLAGGRDYHAVYGKTKPHYLTGALEPTSLLDAWILRGNTIDAFVKDGEFVVELRGLFETEVPEDVHAKAEKQPVTWTARGYGFISRPDKHANGDPCVSTRVARCPVGKSEADAWSYRIVKAGIAQGFLEALKKAYIATSVEVTK